MMVVATASSHEDPHYFDVACTRTIGDWRGSDMVLPHPSMLSFTVPYGQSSRIILASDGLWDVIPAEICAHSVRMHAAPQEAADALVLQCENVLDDKLDSGQGARRDDVTVVVVDVNPSLIDYAPPSWAFRCFCPCPPVVCKLFMCTLLLVLAALAPTVLGQLLRPKTSAAHARGHSNATSSNSAPSMPALNLTEMRQRAGALVNAPTPMPTRPA